MGKFEVGDKVVYFHTKDKYGKQTTVNEIHGDYGRFLIVDGDNRSYYEDEFVSLEDFRVFKIQSLYE